MFMLLMKRFILLAMVAIVGFVQFNFCSLSNSRYHLAFLSSMICFTVIGTTLTMGLNVTELKYFQNCAQRTKSAVVILIAFLATLTAYFLTLIYSISYASKVLLGSIFSMSEIAYFVVSDKDLAVKCNNFFMSAAGLLCASFLIATFAVSFSYMYKVAKLYGNSYCYRLGPREVLFSKSLGVSIFATAFSLLTLSFCTPSIFDGEPLLYFFFTWPDQELSAELLESQRIFGAKEQAVRLGYDPGEAKRKSSIVILMADSLRSDFVTKNKSLGLRTPFLGELLSSKHVSRVKMGLSTCSESFCGIASTLASHTLDHLFENNFSLQEILASAGYTNYFIGTGNFDSLSKNGDVFGLGFHHKYTHKTEPHEIHSDDIVISGLNKIPDHPSKPTFIFAFLMSSHVLGKHKPEYVTSKPEDCQRFPIFLFHHFPRLVSYECQPDSTQSVTEIFRNRYRNGVEQLDSYLATIFDILKSKGILDDALVIIVGDHGEALGEHNHIGHGAQLYQEDIHVPMVLYSTKGGLPEKIDFAGQVDIAPTVLDYLGLAPSASFDGQSLLDSENKRYSLHQTNSTTSRCGAVIKRKNDGSFLKVIKCLPSRSTQSNILAFQLAEDPKEQKNIWNSLGKNEQRRMLSRLRFVERYWVTG
jgi:hypothetical protein